MEFTPEQLHEIADALNDWAEVLQENGSWKSAARVWRLAAEVYLSFGNNYDANLDLDAADKCARRVARKTYRG